jgi:hypothetical protein
MTTEPNNNNNEDYSHVTSNVSSNTTDKDLLVVFKALESIGFRFIDHHENWHWIFVEKTASFHNIKDFVAISIKDSSVSYPPNASYTATFVVIKISAFTQVRKR